MRCEEPLREGELVSLCRELEKHGNRPELEGVVINRRELVKLRLICTKGRANFDGPMGKEV